MMNYYIWADEPPGGDWYIYAHDEKVENGGWRFHEDKGQYFYAYFTTRMPDLNLENPAVRADVKKIAKFWLEKGVDGFRLDAAQNVIEEGPGDGLQYDSPSTVNWWIEFNAYVKSINPDAALVGEIWASPYDLGRYHANGQRPGSLFQLPAGICHPAFPEHGTSDSIVCAIREVRGVDAPFSYFSPFLSNHDQATVHDHTGSGFQESIPGSCPAVYSSRDSLHLLRRRNRHAPGRFQSQHHKNSHAMDQRSGHCRILQLFQRPGPNQVKTVIPSMWNSNAPQMTIHC